MCLAKYEVEQIITSTNTYVDSSVYDCQVKNSLKQVGIYLIERRLNLKLV